MSASKKEGIKKRFLGGAVKVIIGSATIKEGINLQSRASVLYNCWLDWNPTDLKQLEGRIWRYGNRYANVRIVIPLMENSMDPFIFQKLLEKTSRINEIWSRHGVTNQLSLEEFNPAELKMGLITDPYALAELVLLQDPEQMQDAINSLKDRHLVEQRRPTRPWYSAEVLTCHGVFPPSGIRTEGSLKEHRERYRCATSPVYKQRRAERCSPTF